MQPNLFTVVLRHPTTHGAIIASVPLDNIAGIALGASPVAEIFIVPMQRSHDTDRAQAIIDSAPFITVATACDGGFTVAPAPTKWGDEVFRSLDCKARNERLAKAKERAEAALQADKAKERARAVVLDHTRDRALFELEARARLVSA